MMRPRTRWRRCGSPGSRRLTRSRLMCISAPAAEQFAVIAFNFETLQAAKRALPAVPCYWLSGFTRDAADGWSPTPEELITRAVAAGYEGVDLLAGGPVNEAFIRRIEDAGLR